MIISMPVHSTASASQRDRPVALVAESGGADVVICVVAFLVRAGVTPGATVTDRLLRDDLFLDE
jgi:hypothetical protein